MKSTFLLGVLSSISLSGCMHLKDVSNVNQDVPAYFTQRDFVSYQQLGPLGGSIDWFAGRLGYRRGDGVFVFTNRLMIGNPTVTVTTLQNAPAYHSVLDKSFSGSAVLPMLKSDVSGKSVIDYEITDVATIVVPDSAKPTPADVVAELQKHGTVIPPGVALWWVNVVGLSTIRYSVANNTSGNSTLASAAMQVNGAIYDNQSVGVYVPLASVLVQPMNAAADAELRAMPRAPALAPSPAALAPATLSQQLAKLDEKTRFALESVGADMLMSVSALVGSPGDVPPSKQVVPATGAKWEPRLTHAKPGLLKWEEQP